MHLPPEVCLPYIDDCLVLGRTIQKNLDNLELVLKAFQDTGDILKAESVKQCETKLMILDMKYAKMG